MALPVILPRSTCGNRLPNTPRERVNEHPRRYPGRDRRQAPTAGARTNDAENVGAVGPDASWGSVSTLGGGTVFRPWLADVAGGLLPGPAAPPRKTQA